MQQCLKSVKTFPIKILALCQLTSSWYLSGNSKEITCINLVSLLISLNMYLPLTLFRRAFSGLLTDGEEAKKATLPKICRTYPTMMKLSTLILYYIGDLAMLPKFSNFNTSMREVIIPI